MKVLQTILFVLAASYSSGQSTNDSITFRGCIIKDKTSEGISDVYIKITSKKRPYILAYTNTGKENCFSISIHFTSEDSFFITASHITHQTSTVSKLIASSGLINFEINMPPQKEVLKEVVITTPPVWVRGDTTFFKAEYFKEGEERKLKDLIVKMPGFEIDEAGNLLYRKRKIEKIMIEGEEIFSDKIKLILNNLPVHVLNTVQALDNQTENKLLKGLTSDNKVFLNLGIKKEKLKAAFGDGEAGIGSDTRYLLSTTIFALHGKNKAGYIGNQNNIGSGFDWGEQNELTNDAAKTISNWAMQSSYLQTVNNFGSKRYIQNRKWDNRLQVNSPISKKIKGKTEVGFIVDKQQQNSFFNSILLNDSIYINRTTANSMEYLPSTLLATNETSFQPSSNSQLNTSIQFYADRSKSKLDAATFESASNYSINNLNKNNIKSVSIITNLTIRKSNEIGIRYYLESSISHLKQQSVGLSNNWPQIFQLPLNTLTILNQDYSGKLFLFHSVIEKIKKTKKGIITTGINTAISNSKIENTTIFSDYSNNIYKLDSLSNSGHYLNIKLTAYAEKSITILKKPISIKAGSGIEITNLHEVNNLKKISSPIVNVEISQRSKLSKLINYNYNISYSQKQVEQHRFHNLPFPTSISRFQNNKGVEKTIKSLSGRLYIGHAFKKLVSAFWNIGYTHNFSSVASYNSFNQLFQVNSDTILNAPSKSFNYGINIIIPSLKLNTKFEIGFSRNYSHLLFVSANNIHYYKTFFSAGHLIVKRNWNKKYFVSLNSRIVVTNNISEETKSNNYISSVVNFNTSLNQQAIIKKKFALLLNTEWYRYNINSGIDNTVFFVDFEGRYNPIKKPWSFSFVLSNIFNEQNFYSNSNTIFWQSFTSFPLIKRNIFLSFRYEL